MLTDEELLGFCRANEPARVEQRCERRADRDVAYGDWRVVVSMETEVAHRAFRSGRAGMDGDGCWGRTTGNDAAGRVGAGGGCGLGESRAVGCSFVRRSGSGLRGWCPQFVVEVRSESDGLAELQAKMGMWIGNGVELGWLIDPATDGWWRCIGPEKSREGASGFNAACRGAGVCAGLSW